MAGLWRSQAGAWGLSGRVVAEGVVPVNRHKPSCCSPLLEGCGMMRPPWWSPFVPAPRLALATLLVATVAGGANAADLNFVGVNAYARQDQVTSLSQFSEIKPTDWAYQALSNLVDRYGCVAGYPNGSFKGGQSMTRYEAAALLQACLDRVTETTDELKRLMDEFQKELSLLRGRVDGLEAHVGALEATQFSTTTKLSGLATFVLGSNVFRGSAVNSGANTVSRRANELTGQPRSPVPLPNGTTLNYDLQLTFDTSFNGKDRLRTNLRSGNFGRSVFGGDPHALALSTLEIAFEEDTGPDVLGIDKLFYQRPIGNGFTATLGARVGQEDMLALWPSVYPSDTILNLMTVNGAPAAYNKNLGAGAGLWWQKDALSISANYVTANGDSADSSAGGIATASSGASGTVQLAYGNERLGLAAIYTYLQPENNFVPGTTPFTHSAIDHNGKARTNAFGLSGYLQPSASGWLPSLSLGWGYNTTSYVAPQPAGSLSTSQSWMVGLQWTDVLVKGNDFGMAVGQPVFAASLTGSKTPDDGGLAWEWWYKVQLTDNITITPAVIYLSRPLGQATPIGERFSQFGGLVKTSFSF